VLILAAHPDDESLGTAGIIQRAREAGRRVVAAIATNGEGSRTASSSGECNAPGSPEQRAAAYGLLRDREAREAVGVLGLNWSGNLMQTELIFLGYDGGGVPATARADLPRTDDITGLHRTYAEDFDGDAATCNGDFRYLLTGEHSSLSASAIAADLDALLDVVDPSDVYTHAHFDGHPDHAEVYRQIVAAIRRTNTSARVHTTIMHPEGDESCMQLSAARWPNPPLIDNDPFARFTPWLDVTATPARPCEPDSADTRWGPLGPPNELVEVPASMQEPLESANQKWRAIAEHESQVDCTNPDLSHVTCGYMRAFVKRHEFFWTYDYRGRRVWPVSFEANWSSDQSISDLAQVLEGEWRYEGNGVRPLATGFDRALVLGDMQWTDYEVRAPITVHSSDATESHGTGAGIALGWQGHTAWDQPRKGHPTGGLCLYSRSSNGSTQLQIGYSPGPVHDTTVAQVEFPLTEGVPYVFRFRQEAGPPGTTRYSCKVWRADRAEPSEWTLTANIPLWPEETSQHPGSAVLLAHEVDATFGDVRVSPVAP
jgi:LmbE family N-acetylglucosaminyl deacetylase